MHNETLLAIDTSTHTLYVTLQHQGILWQSVAPVEKHANAINTTISTLCDAAHTTLQDIDCFVVNHGPGSFTGLRVGLATAQALAHACQRPILSLANSLIVAYQCIQTDARIQQGDTLAIMHDAKLGEVYFALYQVNQHQIPVSIMDETVCPPSKIAQVLQPVNTFRCGPAWPQFAKHIPASWLSTANCIPAMQIQEGIKNINLNTIHQHRQTLSPASIMLDYYHHCQAQGLAINTEHASALKPNYVRQRVAETTEERAAKQAAKHSNTSQTHQPQDKAQ